MADKPIGDLTQATQLGDNDLFVLEQNGIAKKMLMSLWKDYISRNVVSASATQLPAGSQPTVAFNAATGALTLGIPKGDKGDRGEPGASSAGYVSGIVKGDGTGNVSAATPNVDYTEPWVSTKPYAAEAYCVHKGYLWHNTSGAASTGVEPGTNYNVWNVTYRNENLLDNADFRNPVNQRGVASGAGWNGTYGLDRWFALYNNVANWNSAGYVNFPANKQNCLIEQYLDRHPNDGDVCTCSFMDIDGQIWATTFLWSSSTNVPLFNGNSSAGLINGKLTIRFWFGLSTTINMVRCKFELGPISTLANDTAPNYAEELAKCQRYYQRLQNVFILIASKSQVNAYFSQSLLFPTTMRAAPAVAYATDASGNIGIVQGYRYVTDIYDVAYSAHTHPDRYVFEAKPDELLAGKALELFDISFTADL